MLDSLEAGGDGYSGIAANFFPHLYAWLCAKHRMQPDETRRLQQFLSVADMAARHRYPLSAKRYLGRLGLPIGPPCRVPVAAPSAGDDDDLVLEHLQASVTAHTATLS